MAKATKVKNAILVRLYDVETVRSIEELMETEQFDSMNELMNQAINRGIEKIYLDFGKRKVLKQTEEPEMPEGKRIDRLEHELRKVRVLEEDMYILMNSIEALAASSYNVQCALIKGDEVSAELLDSGYLATLPDAYREIKDGLEARFKRKLSNENKKGDGDEE